MNRKHGFLTLAVALFVGALVYYLIALDKNGYAVEQYRLYMAGRIRPSPNTVTFLIRAKLAMDRARVIAISLGAVCVVVGGFALMVKPGEELSLGTASFLLFRHVKQSASATSDSLRRMYLWAFWMYVLINALSGVLDDSIRADRREAHIILAAVAIGATIWLLWAQWRLLMFAGSSRLVALGLSALAMIPYLYLASVYFVGRECHKAWGPIGKRLTNFFQGRSAGM